MSSAAVKLSGDEAPPVTKRSVRNGTFCRTTVILPATLERNIAVVCAIEGVTKSDYLAGLAERDLIGRGFDPSTPPRAETDPTAHPQQLVVKNDRQLSPAAR